MWKRIERKVLHENPYWSAIEEEYETSTGRRGRYYYAQTPGSVLVVPQRSDGRFVLARQYRYLWGGWGLEFPGGACPATVSPEEQAALELREETGYCAQEWIGLGSVSPCVGLLDEHCQVYWARDVYEVAAPSLEESEEIECVICSAQEIEQAIVSGTMWSGMSLSAWMLFRAFSGALSEPSVSKE